MGRSFLYLGKSKDAPMIFANPGARGGIEWKNVPQETWQRETLLLRLEPAHKVCELVLFTASTAIN